MIRYSIVFLLVFMFVQNGFAQQKAMQGLQLSPTDSSINKKAAKALKDEQDLQQIPDKYLKKVNNKIEKYNGRLTKKTEKTLERLSKYETKIQAVLQKTSPQTEQRLFGNGQMTFTSLLQKLKNGETVTTKYQTQYDGYNDQLTTRLKYLNQQKGKLDSTMAKPVAEATKNMDSLNKEENQTAAIQQFIKERKKQLMTGSIKYLQNSKYLANINKEAFYYEATLKNYKEIFSDPNKVEQAATGILSKMPAFQKFARHNSMLSSLFGSASASNAADTANSEALAGLQTREQVQGAIQQQIAAGGPNAQAMIAQNIQQAQAQLNQLKDKLQKGSSTGGDLDGAFKPNMQKTKTFAQRLDYGFNIQFAKANSYVPTSASMALTIGYKLTDKMTAGIGASYNLGMGSIQHIQFSNQGVGLRSFVDTKLKKQLFITGGFELSNNPALTGNEIPSGIVPVKIGGWQQAALVGLTKKLSIKSKYFKATNIQLLYDLLCNQHIPKSQPVMFRIGYSF